MNNSQWVISILCLVIATGMNNFVTIVPEVNFWQPLVVEQLEDDPIPKILATLGDYLEAQEQEIISLIKKHDKKVTKLCSWSP